jgi:hypothetical protein
MLVTVPVPAEVTANNPVNEEYTSPEKGCANRDMEKEAAGTIVQHKADDPGENKGPEQAGNRAYCRNLQSRHRYVVSRA